MPEIAISSTQRERLDSLRAELATDAEGPSASVTAAEALEYLLDLADATGTRDRGTPAVRTDGGESAGEADHGETGTRLDATRRLLREHDDKWRESSGVEPYEVELPDGSVEAARTKHDVRALLFKHYR